MDLVLDGTVVGAGKAATTGRGRHLVRSISTLGIVWPEELTIGSRSSRPRH
jgi:hypothetical protein